MYENGKRPTINNVLIEIVKAEIKNRKGAGSDFFPAITAEMVADVLEREYGTERSLTSIERALADEMRGILAPAERGKRVNKAWVPLENAFIPSSNSYRVVHRVSSTSTSTSRGRDPAPGRSYRHKPKRYGGS